MNWRLQNNEHFFVSGFNVSNDIGSCRRVDLARIRVDRSMNAAD